MTTIIQALADDERADAHHLLETLDAWRRERQGDNRLPSEHRDDEGPLAAGLLEAPGPYAPPRGRLLIAYEADQPAGAAALRDLGDGICEVDWMFVPPPFQRQRVGQALAERLLLEARAAGYQRMRCHVGPSEDGALSLCERMGFQPMDSRPEPSDNGAEPRVLLEQDLRLGD